MIADSKAVSGTSPHTNPMLSAWSFSDSNLDLQIERLKQSRLGVFLDAAGLVVSPAEIAFHYRNSIGMGRKGAYGCTKGFKKIDIGQEEVLKKILENYQLTLKLREAEIVGTRQKLDELRLYSYDVPLVSIRKDSRLVGQKILHITDIHLMHKHHKKSIRLVQALLDALEKREDLQDVKVIVFTGDFIDKSEKDLLPEALPILKRISQDRQVLYVLGNHDFHDGEFVVHNYLKQAGFTDITNQVLTCDMNGEKVNFVGMDDPYEGTPIYPDSKSLDQGLPTIALVHHIDALNRKHDPFLDLVVYGHMHGIEVNLGEASLNYMKNTGFLYNHNETNTGWKALTARTLAYGSPGMSTHSPIRFNSPKPGITLLTLKSSSVLSSI